MKLNKIGEFGLVDKIKRAIYSQKHSGSKLMIGPGDDAFVARQSPGFLLVGTKDLLIEDVHFRRDWTTPEALGYKSLAVNLSDLAAMGAVKPLYALIGVALPGDIPVDFVDKMYIGMCKISKEFGVILAGGDTTSSKKHIVISITLLGEAKKQHIIKRSGARPGDLVVSTGTFGDSAGGLYLLKKGIKPLKNYQKYLINKHVLPKPKLKEAGIIARNCLATSMMDSSDGLSACAMFLSEASKTGITIDIDKIPVSKQLIQLKKENKDINLTEMILTGGEEYELVFTVHPGKLNKLKKLLPMAKAVGRVTKEKGIKYLLNNKLMNYKFTGYEHFSS